MPVLNEEAHIGAALEALARQTYDGEWELVVADNGCTDRSIEIVRGFTDVLPSLTVADASGRRGINHARNVGARAARGDFLAFCDADDVTAPDWLAAMASAAPHGDLVAGVLDLDALNGEVARTLTPWEAPVEELPSNYGFLPWVAGGNCGVWTSVARELRWDERFVFGSSDIEFSWRAQLASYRVHLAPDAVVAQRLKPGLAALARQQYVYGKSDPQLYRQFREHGMPRPDGLERIHSWRGLVARSRDLAGPLELRAQWLRAAARKTGRMVGSVRHRAYVP